MTALTLNSRRLSEVSSVRYCSQSSAKSRARKTAESVFSENPHPATRHRDCFSRRMLQPLISLAPRSPSPDTYRAEYLNPLPGSFVDSHTKPRAGALYGLGRRWRRMRRRRKVGRAYDMAIEVFRALPSPSADMRVLDVGCGSGYIAHHLSAILGTSVMGVDLGQSTEAPINYRPFDGAHFPNENSSIDLVLFCYVLHHAQNLDVLLSEVQRVLRPGGRISVYEDIPETSWDRIVCSIHNRKWRRRTGPCNFQTENGWRRQFESAGFEVMSVRRLSRGRNLTHPVSRRMFMLEMMIDGKRVQELGSA